MNEGQESAYRTQSAQTSVHCSNRLPFLIPQGSYCTYMMLDQQVWSFTSSINRCYRLTIVGPCIGMSLFSVFESVEMDTSYPKCQTGYVYKDPEHAYFTHRLN